MIWLEGKLGLSGTELGVLYAINQFFSMLFTLVYGFLQDKLGTRKHFIWLIRIVITLSGPPLIYVYESLSASNFKPGMILGVIFFGLSYFTGHDLAEGSVKKVSRKFSLEFDTARLWGSPSYTAGTFVGSTFFSINPHTNFWCVSVMGVLSLLINVLFKTNSPAPPSIKTRSPEPDALIRKDFLTIPKNTQFWFFVIFIVDTWSFYSIYDQQMFPVFYASSFSDPELAPRAYGYLNSVQVFTEAIGMALAPFLISCIGPKSVLLLGGTVMACRILGSVLFTDTYIISLIKVLHTPEVPLFVISVFKFSVTNFDKRLSSTICLTGFNIVSSIGTIVLSLPTGKLFDKMGYQEIFLIIANIVITTLILGYFSLSEKHHRQKMGSELVTE